MKRLAGVILAVDMVLGVVALVLAVGAAGIIPSSPWLRIIVIVLALIAGAITIKLVEWAVEP